MKKKYVYIAIAVVAVAFVSYWLTRNPKSKVAAPEQSQRNEAMEVNAVVVVPRAFSNTITLSGSIEPNEPVQIRSEVSGIVRELTRAEERRVGKEGVRTGRSRGATVH